MSRSTKLPVTAAERGYYGAQIREPGEKFNIEAEDDLGSWMIPNGWTPPKKGQAVKLSKVAVAAAAEAEPVKAEDEDAKTFRGVEADYGTDTVRVTKAQAIDRALDDLDTDIDTWNKMTEKDRKSAFMSAVKTLVNEGIAAEAAGIDEDETEDA